MGRFAILLRCSTDEQSQSGHGLRSQLDSCQSFVSSNNGEVIGIFSDEGVSGGASLDKRPGLLAAIDALKKGDVLLVGKRDRLGRDPILVAMAEAAVARKGARIMSAAGEGTLDDDPTSVLMRRIVDCFSEYERLIIKSRVKSALQAKKRRNERIGHIPFGSMIAEDRIHLLPCEKEQKILLMILKLRKSKMSFQKIAAELNRNCFSNRGGKWHSVSVFRVSRGKIAA